MYKNKNILRGAVVLFIVAVMFFSSVAVANTKSKTQLEPFGKGQDPDLRRYHGEIPFQTL